jgi:hypothetical protein
MHCKSNKPGGPSLLAGLLLALLCGAGCAVKPWTPPLQDVELRAATDTIDRIMAKQTPCGTTIRGDLALSINHSLSRNSVAGYFEFSQPSSYKFIVSNTFDQPVLIITGDQKSYRVINTLSRSFLSGSLRSFGVRNRISPQILGGNWQEWITGGKTQPSYPLEIRRDVKSNGIWATYRTSNIELEHLYFDPDGGNITQRLLEGRNGEKLAEITYGQWFTKDSCRQPTLIRIREPGVGVEISLELTDVTFTNTPGKYSVPVPPGFSRTYLP